MRHRPGNVVTSFTFPQAQKAGPMPETTRHPLPHSLTARVAALALAFLLAGLWSLAWYADLHLRRDLRQQLQVQQQTLAMLLARELERTLGERSQALQALAQQLHLHSQGLQPRKLQQLLPELPVVQQMFTGGYYVTDTQGLAIASYPAHLLEQRRSFAYSRTTRGALAGQLTISEPMAGLIEGRPVMVIGVPVPGDDGRIAGSLIGVVKLREAGLLQPLPDIERQTGGSYLVADRDSRAIVAASADQLVLQSLPLPGEDAALDRLLASSSGSAIRIEQGQEMLVSVRPLQAAPWLVLISQPTAQVFAPLDALRQRIRLAALALTLVLAAGIWWLLTRALQPLKQMGQRLSAMAENTGPLQPLQPQSTRELGQLVQGCNHLLAELEQRQRALHESQQLYRTAFMTNPDSIDITRVRDGAHLDINPGFEHLFGWPRELVLQRSGLELGIWRPEDAPLRERFVRQVLAEGGVTGWEQQLWHRNGSPLTVLMHARLLDVQGEPCMLWVTHDISALRAADARIQRLTSTDQLTNLPNLQQFMQELEHVQARCLGAQRMAALICLDLDDFKTINDSLGHDHGDQLLRQVGQRLSALMRPQGLVARLGSDEFLVLQPDLPAPLGAAAQQAQKLAHRLTALLAQPLQVQGMQHSISAGMGIVLLGEQHQEPRELLRRAGLALNQAKAGGPGTALFFELQMQDQVSSRALLQRSLREALQQQQFLLHYQPQLDQAGVVVGVEALVRWPLPGRGLVPPNEFIPLAEKTGLIVPLGRWVLHAACSQLAQWAGQPARRHLDIAVNVSAGQFQQEDFVQQVQQALQHTGAPPSRLKIELTESLMMYQIDSVIDRMKTLRAMGLRFSLDDFGTGFSSLAYLKRLPLQQLKIDQGFVRDILDDHNDAAIARTILALGESLGLEVIAEGVETRRHLDTLTGWGCRYFQGYWFSRPLPIEQLEDFLQQRQLAVASDQQA